MSILEFLLIGIIFLVLTVVYTIVIYELVKTIRRLEDFIMAQKDITAFNKITQKPVGKTKEDKKKEKENQDFGDFVKIVNSGVADNKDIERFGTATVDQG